MTKKELRKILKYYPSSGEFFWEISGKGFNKGDKAGYINSYVGYVYIGIKGKYYLAHRLAWLYMTGNWPENQIDHKDRNRGNNRWENLLDVTQTQNNHNAGLRKNNKSGVTGVSRSKTKNKWVAQYYYKKSTIPLGSFEDFDDAVKARYKAEIKYGYTRIKETSYAYKYLKEKGLL